MIDKDPAAIHWLTYAWVLVLSSWGGVVGYLRKVNSGQLDRFSLTHLAGEIMTSAFAGVITYWLATAADINDLVTAALVGVSGHMGTRAVCMIETYLQEKVAPKAK